MYSQDAAIHHVTLVGHVGNRELDRRLAALVPGAASEEQMYDKIVFDLAGVEFVELGSLLYLLVILSTLGKRGVACELRLPTGSAEPQRRFRDILKRLAFFEVLGEVAPLEDVLPRTDRWILDEEPQHYSPRLIADGEHAGEELVSRRLMAIRCFAGRRAGGLVGAEPRIQGYVSDWLRDRTIEVLSHLLDKTRKDVTQIATVLAYESLLNTVEHARNASVSLVGAVVQRPYLTIAIADDGIGIPDTVRTHFRPLVEGKDDASIIRFLADQQAIQWATKEKTTSKPEIARARRGYGLYYVKRTSLGWGGFLRIRSGHAQVRFTPADPGGEHGGKAVANWPGTLVSIYLPVAVGR